MKRRIPNLLPTAGLMLALVVTVTPSFVRSVAGTPPAPQERQGFQELRRAEQLLKEARDVLSAAPGEYGGHRDKAIKHIDEALGQIHDAYEHH